MQRGNNVRFVLVSATAPNIEDLKDWLSSCSSGETTNMFKVSVVWFVSVTVAAVLIDYCQFGDEYRPCKLQRHVYGFPRPQGHNDVSYVDPLLCVRESNPIIVSVYENLGLQAISDHPGTLDGKACTRVLSYSKKWHLLFVDAPYRLTLDAL